MFRNSRHRKLPPHEQASLYISNLARLIQTDGFLDVWFELHCFVAKCDRYWRNHRVDKTRISGSRVGLKLETTSHHRLAFMIECSCAKSVPIARDTSSFRGDYIFCAIFYFPIGIVDEGEPVVGADVRNRGYNKGQAHVSEPRRQPCLVFPHRERDGGRQRLVHVSNQHRARVQPVRSHHGRRWGQLPTLTNNPCLLYKNPFAFPLFFSSMVPYTATSRSLGWSFSHGPRNGCFAASGKMTPVPWQLRNCFCIPCDFLPFFSHLPSAQGKSLIFSQNVGFVWIIADVASHKVFYSREKNVNAFSTRIEPNENTSHTELPYVCFLELHEFADISTSLETHLSSGKAVVRFMNTNIHDHQHTSLFFV